MFNRIKEFLLNTPEKYWLVVFGYHLHKSFWGVILIILGLIIITTYSLILGIVLLCLGTLLLILSISGNVYTNNRPYFQLWKKYEK